MQRVLVVEHDVSIREVVKLRLERAGFKVEAAADGRRGRAYSLGLLASLHPLRLGTPKLLVRFLKLRWKIPLL
jgi:DNA-binding response OmpR family regulator